jgi:hypothetical protein
LGGRRAAFSFPPPRCLVCFGTGKGAGRSATTELPPFVDPSRAGDWSYRPDTTRLRAAAAAWRGRIVVAGQASSHCVRWSVDDPLGRMRALDPALPGRVFVLRRPIPELDFTPQAEEAFARWVELGVHIVESAQPMAEWPR